MSRKRVAILISGRGSNMSALIEAAKAPDYPAEIVGVFSNRPDAAGLGAAAAQGIPTASRSHREFPSREAFDDHIQSVLDGWKAEIVCLAGFMRIFSTPFAARWTGRMLNIHPSLLPRHKGLKPQQQALDAGDTESGCTVHWVVPDLDDGPVILQARVPVLSGDTADSLAARILVEEHRLYPLALAMVARGEVACHSYVFVRYCVKGPSVKREQLIQKFRKEARQLGLTVIVNMARGEGGHCLVTVGERTTIIPSGEISPAFEKIIRRQLGL